MKQRWGWAFVAVTCALGTNAPGADDVGIVAPESSVTVKTFGGRAIVDGWSCGADIVEDAVAILTELGRRRAILSRQVDAGRALAKTPAIRQETDKQLRLRIFDDVLRSIVTSAPPEVRALTRREEFDLQEFDRFGSLTTHRGGKATFTPGGITDGGATALHILPDCFQTIHTETLAAQVKAAATDVFELRNDLRLVRDAVSAGAEV